MESPPIPQLVDDLRCQDMKKRIAALGHIDKIADVLKGERTRTELLPYISGKIGV